jgi:hypothetical protein
MVCYRYTNVNTQHKGYDDDDDDTHIGHCTHVSKSTNIKEKVKSKVILVKA